jgi:nitrite reductase (NADH) small subunit
MRRVEVGGTPVLVVRDTDGEFYALRNACAHQGAPLSAGDVVPLVTATDVGKYEDDGRMVIMCPRHGYEFDIKTGECPAEPERLRQRVYPVSVEDGRVVLER